MSALSADSVMIYVLNLTQLVSLKVQPETLLFTQFSEMSGKFTLVVQLTWANENIQTNVSRFTD